MSEPAPASTAAPAPPPAFPRLGWILLAVSGVLGAAALLLTRLDLTPTLLLSSGACSAVGFALARHAYKLARASHARLPLMVCGALLGFLVVPLMGIVALGVLYLLAPGSQ